MNHSSVTVEYDRVTQTLTVKEEFKLTELHLTMMRRVASSEGSLRAGDVSGKECQALEDLRRMKLLKVNSMDWHRTFYLNQNSSKVL